MARRNSNPKFKSARGKGSGRGAQIVRARRRAKIGVIMKRKGEEVDGRMGSLIKSFTPSAMGWSRPKGPTMFGPFRACM